MYDPTRHQTLGHLEHDRQRAAAHAAQLRAGRPKRHPSAALALALRAAATRLDHREAYVADPEQAC